MPYDQQGLSDEERYRLIKKGISEGSAGGRGAPPQTSSDDDAIYALIKARMGSKSQGVPSPVKQEVPHSLGGFIGNIPGSAAQTGKALLQLLPGMGTYTSLAKVGAGGISKMVGDRFELPEVLRGNEAMFDAAVGAMKERYGNPLETMYHDPVGSLVDIAGLLSGVGGVAKGVAGAGARMGTQLPRVAQAGQIAGKAAEIVNPLTYAAKGVNALATGVGKTGLGALGLMTGRGKAAGDLWNTRKVMTGGEALLEGGKPMSEMQASTGAMRGAITEMDSVKNLRTALQMAKDKRMNEYVRDLPDVPLREQFNRVHDGFYRQLEDFRIRRSTAATGTPEEVIARRPVDPGAVRGTPEAVAYDRELQQWSQDLGRSINAAEGTGNAPRLDFKGSGISPNSEAGAKILEMDKLFSEWAERYPSPTTKDLDLLKRSIDEMYSVDSRARKIVQATKADLRNELNQSVPGYRERTRKYHEASDKIEQLEMEFSLNNKNPGVTIRKMSNALNQNNEFRKDLVTDLNSIAPGMGDRIIAEMAGHHFSGWMPKGLIGQLGGLGLGARFLQNPASPSNLLLGLTSPRLVGEGITAVGALPLAENVAGLTRASANPLLTAATRGAAGEVGYGQVGATPSTIPEADQPARFSEVKRQMPDGAIHVFDGKTGAYLRTEK